MIVPPAMWDGATEEARREVARAARLLLPPAKGFRESYWIAVPAADVQDLTLSLLGPGAYVDPETGRVPVVNLVDNFAITEEDLGT